MENETERRGINAVHRKGHEIGVWHRDKQEWVPDRDAWRADAARAKEKLRNDGWDEFDIMLVLSYAYAALCYDGYQSPVGRGLWARDGIGNVGFDDFDIPRVNGKDDGG